MPRETRTYHLDDVAQDLDQELDELADQAAAAEEEGEVERLHSRAQTVEQHLVGVQWALDEYGPDAEVTLGALNAGEYAQVGDRTIDMQTERVGGADSSQFAGSILFTAAGIVEAPFVDEGASFEERVIGVREVAPQFKEWLEDEVDALTTPDVDLGNGFAARVAEKSSTAPKNSPSPEQS